jgi:anti-sigma factor RsiW
VSGIGDSLHCEQRTLGAAYLLGALEPDEHERYEEHLRTCAICGQELQQLQPSVDALCLGVTEMQAPLQVRDRVMEIVRQEESVLRAAGPQADRPAAAARRRWPRPALAFGSAVAAAAVAIGILVGVSGSPSETVIAARVAAVAPHGQAQLRESSTRAELVVAGMPQPPAGKIYQVWLARPGRSPEPTDALFSVTRSGSGSVAVPQSLHGVAQLMVTAEPDGGSLHPTSAPIIIATLH